MDIRTVFLRNVLFLGITGGIGVSAVIVNAAIPDAGFGTVLIVVLAVILLIAGLFTGWGSYLMGSDRRALSALLRGDKPQPGHLAAASGVVRAGGPLLDSPLKGIPCVAYEYTIHVRTSGTGSSSGKRYLCYEGRHMAATFLDGPQGCVRIASLPSLEEFVQEDLELERAQELGERLSQEAKIGFLAYLRSRRSTNRNNYHELAEDWALRHPGQWDTGIVMQERALPENVQVCAIGVWGEGESALCSPYRWRFARISMELGTPEEVLTRTSDNAHQLARVALGCLGASGILFAVMPILSILR